MRTVLKRAEARSPRCRAATRPLRKRELLVELCDEGRRWPSKALLLSALGKEAMKRGARTQALQAVRQRRLAGLWEQQIIALQRADLAEDRQGLVRQMHDMAAIMLLANEWKAARGKIAIRELPLWRPLGTQGGHRARSASCQQAPRPSPSARISAIHARDGAWIHPDRPRLSLVCAQVWPRA